MNVIIYPKRVENRLHILDFEYAEPEDIFHVHDIFVLLYRVLFLKKRSEKADNCNRLLLCTVLELYGWKHIPLYAALKNPQSTYEEIKASRCLRFHQEQETEALKAINIYWSYHDALLKLPFAWYRPGILAGDVFCHEIFRFEREGRMRTNREKPLLPSLTDESYFPFRRDLSEVGKIAIERCQDIERVFVEFYGSLTRESITVQDIVDAEPEVKEEFFFDWSMM